jgi:hypothetical protein
MGRRMKPVRGLTPARPASAPKERAVSVRVKGEGTSVCGADTVDDAADTLDRARPTPLRVAPPSTPPQRSRSAVMLDRALTTVLLTLTVLIVARARITIHVYVDAGVLVALFVAWLNRGGDR